MAAVLYMLPLPLLDVARLIVAAHILGQLRKNTDPVAPNPEKRYGPVM